MMMMMMITALNGWRRAKGGRSISPNITCSVFPSLLGRTWANARTNRSETQSDGRRVRAYDTHAGGRGSVSHWKAQNGQSDEETWERGGRWSAIGSQCMCVFCSCWEGGVKKWNTCRYNGLLWPDSLWMRDTLSISIWMSFKFQWPARLKYAAPGTIQ